MDIEIIEQGKRAVEVVNKKLEAEFRERGYAGNVYITSFSKEAQEYIIDRHNRGIAELKAKGKYPKENKDNGYTALLGVWYYTKRGGIDCAIGLKKVWMAQLINEDII